eukprot:scaffold233_cov174-Ochromonas_danica.AAC.62
MLSVQGWLMHHPGKKTSWRSALAALSPETSANALPAKQYLTQSITNAAKVGAITLGSTLLFRSGARAFGEGGKKSWVAVELPVKETLFDISFDPANPDHGWLVGARGTFFETFDGGNKWVPRSFTSLDAEEEITYRFQVASLKDQEGWIVGKPSIMLHSKDGGKGFERIPLSPKLPGDPVGIFATGAGTAEMITSQGAIYTTSNGGLNWKASVKETIDATLNRVSSSGTTGASYFTGKLANHIRDSNGNYLAIASRGNLFLTWQPGQEYWIPHNRGSSRRIQNMGFVGNDASKGVWMSLNGGALLLTPPNPDLSRLDLETLFTESKINSGGYGIIDLAWRTPDNVWAVGGSGVMFESTDGGKNFRFVDDAKDFPTNLYRVKFFGENRGFALGSAGVLLRYNA